MEQSKRTLLGSSLLAVSWAYAVLVAFYVLYVLFVQPEFWTKIPTGIRAVAVLLGIAVLALNGAWVAFFVRGILTGEGSQYLLSRTAEGTARISLRAVQASLLRRVRELPEVIGARVTVRRPGEKRLRVDVAYTTTENRNAILVSEVVRRALRERFEDLVHSEEGFEVEYDVKIDGFVPAPTPPSAPGKGKDEPEPFTGPRYPVD